MTLHPDRRHVVLSDWAEPIGIRRILTILQQRERHLESVHAWKPTIRRAALVGA